MALTSVLCKCRERLVSRKLTVMVKEGLNPLHFAYKVKRGVGGASLLDTVAGHLNSAHSYLRTLKGQVVEQLKTLDCLGIALDHHLSFAQHVDGVFKKAQQGLFPLRKQRGFTTRNDILTAANKSLVEPALTFNNASLYNSLTVKSRANLKRIIN
ncbi:hypothetical protein SKAU_G00398530 [Synaphobranchus kaupii]|uniref:Uncharacterized protein n=1 Tax=Synaphobranchus kaupii TaxID=118154 RepID=A0A9Q1IC36_SYNKA|nr:hypothetical protein SKAU_G00398530 [Synaphobranchus kaupii]